MPKRTKDYDDVFKTLKMKHKRLFISVINDAFGKHYPPEAKVDVLPSEGYLSDGETAAGDRKIEEFGVYVSGRKAACGLGDWSCGYSHAGFSGHLYQRNSQNAEKDHSLLCVSGRTNSGL